MAFGRASALDGRQQTQVQDLLSNADSNIKSGTLGASEIVPMLEDQIVDKAPCHAKIHRKVGTQIREQHRDGEENALAIGIKTLGHDQGQPNPQPVQIRSHGAQEVAQASGHNTVSLSGGRRDHCESDR